MKWTHVALIAVAVLPLTLLADEPSTQPSRPYAGRMQGMKRDGFMPNVKPTKEELDEAMAFMKDNAPVHYELLNRLPEDAPRRNRAGQLLVMRYRGLMHLKDQNPEAYEAMLHQWQLEDEAMGDARALKEGKPDADVRLREVARRIVQNGLDDRRARIDKLRKALDQQQKQLDQDEQNKDQLMTQLVTDTENKFERLFGGKDRGPVDQGDKPDGKEINALQK